MESNKNTNEGFKLLSNIEKTIEYINKQLINYPKKEVVLKQNIEKTMYLLIEYVFSYRIEELYRVRLKYLKSVVIQISMLDYYMRVSYNKKIINAKRYNSISGFLIEMKKIAYGVIRSEKLSANVS